MQNSGVYRGKAARCGSYPAPLHRAGRSRLYARFRPPDGRLTFEMADVLSVSQRSYCMSRIRGKDTKPEQLIRSGLFSLGFRYRLHCRDLPGCPDLVFRKYRAVIFVHGCLWHGHECHLFKWPVTNRGFWRKKIKRNRKGDRIAINKLGEANWRVMTIWECAMRGRLRQDRSKMLERISRWLLSSGMSAVIKGRRS